MNENLIAILILLLYFSPVLYQLVIVIKEKKKGNPLPIRRFLRFLKFSFLVLFTIAIGFIVLSHTNYLDYEKPIPFKEYDRITFENFRGLEFFKKNLYGNERFAYVVTSIESDINNETVSVQALFHPSRSFVYKKNINSKELLSHEKYHFKITELFARKAKEKISNLKKFDKTEIKNIITKTNEEEHLFQKQYDYDTFHSYVLNEQKKYEKRVDSLLNLLTKYSKPKIQFND